LHQHGIYCFSDALGYCIDRAGSVNYHETVVLPGQLQIPVSDPAMEVEVLPFKTVLFRGGCIAPPRPPQSFFGRHVEQKGQIRQKPVGRQCIERGDE
jgi:hypothetical protein